MDVFTDASEHEQIVFCRDESTGLRAIIAIHSTELGPALGGTRFYPYATEEEAVQDVLRLSEGMTYKNALARLDLGGGKAVIWGDPHTQRSEPLLRAYGRFVNSLGGRYITACDVGTYVADMDLVARETPHVTGKSVELGGAGDSSILTAFGVLQGMHAAAEFRWGSPSLKGKRIGISGVGKVGRILLQHVIDEGAHAVIADTNPRAVQQAHSAHSGIEILTPDELLTTEMDIFSPCAMGGVITESVAHNIRTELICGAANNQLAHSDVALTLHERDVLYTPDYVVNAGGVIQVADELHGFNFERAQLHARAIGPTTSEILSEAQSEKITPSAAADRVAQRRIRDISSLHARITRPSRHK